jgi:hypothetical protein
MPTLLNHWPKLTEAEAYEALNAMSFRAGAFREVLRDDPKALHAAEFLVRRLMASEILRREVAEYATDAAAKLKGALQP